MKTGPVVGPSYGDWLFLKYRPAARTGPWGPTSFSRAPAGHKEPHSLMARSSIVPAMRIAGGKCNHLIQPVCRCSSNATVTATATLGPHLSPPPPCEGTRRPACWAGGCQTCRGGAAQASVKCKTLTRPSAEPERGVVTWAVGMAAARRAAAERQRAGRADNIHLLRVPWQAIQGGQPHALAKQHHAVALVKLQVGDDADAGGHHLRGSSGAVRVGALVSEVEPVASGQQGGAARVHIGTAALQVQSPTLVPSVRWMRKLSLVMEEGRTGLHGTREMVAASRQQRVGRCSREAGWPGWVQTSKAAAWRQLFSAGLQP